MTVDLYTEKLNLTITSMASAQVTFTFEDILNLYEKVQAKYKFKDVFLKEWTKSDKNQNCDACEEIYAIVKKCWQACSIYKV